MCQTAVCGIDATDWLSDHVIHVRTSGHPVSLIWSFILIEVDQGYILAMVLKAWIRVFRLKKLTNLIRKSWLVWTGFSDAIVTRFPTAGKSGSKSWCGGGYTPLVRSNKSEIRAWCFQAQGRQDILMSCWFGTLAEWTNSLPNVIYQFHMGLTATDIKPWFHRGASLQHNNNFTKLRAGTYRSGSNFATFSKSTPNSP